MVLLVVININKNGAFGGAFGGIAYDFSFAVGGRAAPALSDWQTQ